MNTRKILQFFIVLGLMFNTAWAGFLYFLFLMAYFVSHNKSITVYINLFGEADFELVLMSVTMCIGLASTLYVFYEMAVRRENAKNRIRSMYHLHKTIEWIQKIGSRRY